LIKIASIRKSKGFNSLKIKKSAIGIPIALERIEIDIANLLLDNGAVIYKE